MAITNENRLLWEQRFRERKEQGLTIAEWCRQNGFTENQYYYWCKRINKLNQTTDTNGISFAEITPVQFPDGASKAAVGTRPDFRLCFKDMQFYIPSGFQTADLAGLVSVLRSL